MPGSFSFQTSKLTTAGEGGMVTTNDIELAGPGDPPRQLRAATTT
jgi:hypothetical protein